MTHVMTQFDKPDISMKSPQMKWLMLTWEFPPAVVGGLSKHVDGLSKQLSLLGVEVHVITTGDKGLPCQESMNNVYVHRVKPLNVHDDDFLPWIGGLNLAIVYKACELSDKIPFTMIHAHDWLVGAAAIILKESLKLPLLTTIHATETGRNQGIHNEMQQFIHEKERQLVEASDHIIVCSDYMKQELLDIFKIPVAKLTVIPNGIDFCQDNNYYNIHLEKEDKKLIFSIGRTVKEKGFETMIEAAAMAKESKLNVFFAIAGKGPMLEKYRREVQERNINDYIAFIGYLTDEEKNAWIYKSDINVFPSLYEPFGIVALESMVQGKPTIVSNIGGLKGIVTHMKSGLLMIPGNAKSLLEQIIFLITNPKKAQVIGKTGQQMVMSLYGWKHVAIETIKVIEDTCKKGV